MRLILMRHAKSDWSGPTQPDHARHLNVRGRDSAQAMGDWLRRGGFIPDHVLCSTATRTRETLELLSFGDVVTVFEDRLYHAGTETLWHSLSEAPQATVLLVGHNPGMAEFAAMAVDTPPRHDRFDDFPTCATLVVDFPCTSWPEVRTGTGRVRAFAIPREVMERPESG